MKHEVKVSEWFLKNRAEKGKLPVKLSLKTKETQLIGEGDVAVTENIQGIENDPRYIIEPVKSGKPKSVTSDEESKRKIKIKEE